MSHPILKQKTSIDECIVSEIKISVTIGLGKSHGDYNKDKKYDKNRSRSPSQNRNNNSSNDRNGRYDSPRYIKSTIISDSKHL